MDAKKFLIDNQNWDEKSKGMFDFNSLSKLLEDFQNEKDKTFEGTARALIKYLCENHHPHVSVIVTPTGAELLEGLKSTGEILDYIVD